MNALGAALVWCVIQVTLFGLVGAAIYGIARRFGPQNGARAALACLLIVGVLGLAALSPWPSWVARSTGDNAVARTSANAGVNAADSTAVEPDSAKGKTSSTPNESKVKSPRGEKNNGEPAPIGTNAKPAETEIVPTGEPAAGAESGVPPDADSAAPLTALLQSLWEELKRAPAPAAETSDQETETVGWSWRAWLAAVFLGGVAIGLIRMLAGLVAVRRHRQRSRPIEEPKLLETLDLLRAKLGCARPVALCESEALPTAATVGWRRPAILLPSAWRQWSPDQRGAVLAHELAHIGRNDFAAHLTAQLGVLLNFYHPLVHWLSGRLRLEQELAADAEAAELTGGRGAYLTTLAELALASPNIRLGWPAHTFLPTRGMFLRRIEMLRNTKGRAAAETKGRISRIARWASVAALLVAGIAAAGLRAPAGAEPPAVVQGGEEEPQEKELVQKIRIPSDEGATDSPARAPKAHDDSTERSKTSTAIDVANTKSKVEFRLAESEPGEGLVEATLPDSDKKIYLHKALVITGRHIAIARVGVDQSGRPAIFFTLTEDGAERMGEATSKNLPDPTTGGKKSLAILVEGKLISAPNINSVITNQGVIEGNLDEAEVKRLVAAIRGSKPPQRNSQAELRAAETGTSRFRFPYIPNDAFVVAAVRPAEILSDARYKPLVAELDKALGVEALSRKMGLMKPVSLADIEQVTLAIVPRLTEIPGNPAAPTPPQAYRERVIVRFVKPLNIGGFRPKGTEAGELILNSTDSSTLAYWLPDQRTVVVQPLAELQKLIASRQAGAFTKLPDWEVSPAAQGILIVNNLAPFQQEMRRELAGGPVMQMMGPLFESTEKAVVTADVLDGIGFTATVHCKTEQDALRVEETLRAGQVLVKNLFDQQLAASAYSFRDKAEAKAQMTLRPLSREIRDLLASARFSTSGRAVKVESNSQLTPSNLSKVLQTALPLMGASEKAALRAQSQNNLKRIALALHNYHDTHKHFPPAVLYGPDGKTPYSWRVAILPFLEGQGKQLYEAYHFDEPWDGPNNKKLLSQMPDVFRCPQDGPNSTNTSYFVLSGPDTVFSGKKGTGFREITDGTSNTLAVVESVNFKYRSDRQTFRVKGEDSDRVVMRPVWTRVDVPWTKPVDIPYAADKSAPKLGGWYQGGFHVAMCDGSARFFSDKLDENTLRALITKAGAEMIRQDRMSPKPFDEIPEPKMDQELRELLKEQDFRDEPMDGIGPNFFEQEIPDLHQLDIDPKAPIDPDKFKINP